MRKYHVAIHYHKNPTEVYEQEFENTSRALSFASLAVTYPDDVLYVVVLPC